MSSGIVLLLGIPSEPPLQFVANALSSHGLPFVMWNQRTVPETEVDVRLADGAVSGEIHSPDGNVSLDDVVGVYVRLTDSRTLPELIWLDDDSEPVRHAERVTDALLTWLDLTDARVVNRYDACLSNGSKPYQAQLIAADFLVPDTLVTTNAEAARAFWAEHQRVVYKSVSGQRSIVQELTEHDAPRLDALVHCPTQFQQLIDGQDVRVHTLATGEVFATAITSPVVDYRYATSLTGQNAGYAALDISPELANRCLELAARLELAFAGIDLKITPEGAVYCLEVNPSPAYAAYESVTHQPLASALARYLSQGGTPMAAVGVSRGLGRGRGRWRPARGSQP